MIKIDLGKGEGKANDKFAFVQKLLSKLPKSGDTDPKGFLVVILALVLAFVPYLYVSNYKEEVQTKHQNKIADMNAKIDSMKQELNKFSAFEAEMKSYEEQKARIVQRIETVNQLLKTRNAPVNVLDAIGQALPQRAWLTSFDFVMTPAPKVFVSGRAFANEDISDFLDRVTESIYLSEVSLDSVSMIKNETGGEVKAFDVSALTRELGSASNARQPSTVPVPVPASPAPTVQKKNQAEETK